MHSLSVIVSHVLDEASMRMRSYVEAGQAGSPVPKVHNQVVFVHAGQMSCELFTELQASVKKDGLTIATSIVQTAMKVFSSILRGLTTRQLAGQSILSSAAL